LSLQRSRLCERCGTFCKLAFSSQSRTGVGREVSNAARHDSQVIRCQRVPAVCAEWPATCPAT
jgi:hypothetical protein